jgi:hypothetical protein
VRADCFFLVLSLAYSYILKIEAADSTKSLLPIFQSMERYSPEIRALGTSTALRNVIRGTEPF